MTLLNWESGKQCKIKINANTIALIMLVQSLRLKMKTNKKFI